MTFVVSPKKTEVVAHKAVLRHHSEVIAGLASEKRCDCGLVQGFRCMLCVGRVWVSSCFFGPTCLLQKRCGAP